MKTVTEKLRFVNIFNVELSPRHILCINTSRWKCVAVALHKRRPQVARLWS